MMDPKLWQDYLRLLEQLTRTIHQLTGIEQSKTRAASQGNLEELENCMRQEQAMSLSLRGHDQKRDALLARMGLTVPQVSRVFLDLASRGLDVDARVYTVEAAAEQIIAKVAGKGVAK